jgi:hypothetical protein
MEAQSLGVLASYALDDARVDEAVPMLKDAYRIHRSRRDYSGRYWGTIVLCRLAQALALTDEPELAVRVLGRAEALFTEYRMHTEGWLSDMNAPILDSLRSPLDEKRVETARREGSVLTADEAVTLALDVLERWRGNGRLSASPTGEATHPARTSRGRSTEAPARHPSAARRLRAGSRSRLERSERDAAGGEPDTGSRPVPGPSSEAMAGSCRTEG